MQDLEYSACPVLRLSLQTVLPVLANTADDNRDMDLFLAHLVRAQHLAIQELQLVRLPKVSSALSETSLLCRVYQARETQEVALAHFRVALQEWCQTFHHAHHAVARRRGSRMANQPVSVTGTTASLS